MKKNVIIIIALVAVLAGSYVVLTRPSATPPATLSSAPQPVLFTSSPDYSYAVQIYPGSLSDKARTYLENYNLTTEPQSNGSTRITLTPISGTSVVQTYTVQPGQSLYFVEKFLTDDNSTVENNPRDDYGIIVGADGYIVTP